MLLKTVRDIDVTGKVVLVRLDINSPIDRVARTITNSSRIEKSLPTLQYLIKKQAKIILLAHQGDTLDYQNLLSLKEHANILSGLLNQTVTFCEDVCGPVAISYIKELNVGQILMLENCRYLTEEVSTFENYVNLSPDEMRGTWLCKQLIPEIDIYVNDAFSAAHRNAPSLVAFQSCVPSVVGFQYEEEMLHLSHLLHPSGDTIYILGGAKVSDAFGMMKEVLVKGKVKCILTTGVVGMIFLAAKGVALGDVYTDFLRENGMWPFISEAKELLAQFSEQICCPVDVAFQNQNHQREEISVTSMATYQAFYGDIGSRTIAQYSQAIRKVDTIFANGPAGIYEDEETALGTKMIFQCLAQSEAYSVIGGGDTVTAANKYIDLRKINYVSTAGGALIQFLSGKKLPLVEAMKQAFIKYQDVYTR